MNDTSLVTRNGSSEQRKSSNKEVTNEASLLAILIGRE